MKGNKCFCPAFVWNAFCLSASLILLFSVVLLMKSEHQREVLCRAARSVLGSKETLKMNKFIPNLELYGNQWRFVGENTNDVGDCSQIPSKLNQRNIINEGYSKVVYQYGNVAIKKLLLNNGRGFGECRKNGHNISECTAIEVNGFLTEIGMVLLFQSDPNVPKLFAYCIPGDFQENPQEISAMVEMGKPLDTLTYLNLRWEDRVGMVSEILEFLKRLQPLSFLDFRRQQFVLRSSNHPIYVDFDSVTKMANSSDDREAAARVFDAFVNRFLWVGRPMGSGPVLTELRNGFRNHSIGLDRFHEEIDKLKTFRL